MAAHQIDRSTILDVQAERRFERGGLEQRFFLLWVETDAPDKDSPVVLTIVPKKAKTRSSPFYG